MGVVVKRYKDTKLKELVDTETGEIIDTSELGLIQRASTGEISISSKTYAYLDTNVLSNLIKIGIKQVDLALLVTLSSNLLIGCNVCMKDENDPHTTSSIAKLIGNSDQAVKIKLNRLIKLKALHYGILKENKRLGKVYIINPHIIRKGLKFKASLGIIFM